MSAVLNSKKQIAKEFGILAEQLAQKEYIKNGYKILKNNYRTRHGEIDIIAAKDNYIVFIEVKARAQNSIASPIEFVNYAKQKKIILAAQHYLMCTKDSTSFVRFDVVGVVKNKNYELQIIENAFSQ